MQKILVDQESAAVQVVRLRERHGELERRLSELERHLSLTPDEQIAITVYVPGQEINTTAVIRHALDDAKHHLLDVRRGIARQDLRKRDRSV